MIFLEKLEIVLVERPRDHPILFPATFVIDLYLTKASIWNYAVLGLAVARSNEREVILEALVSTCHLGATGYEIISFTMQDGVRFGYT